MDEVAMTKGQAMALAFRMHSEVRDVDVVRFTVDDQGGYTVAYLRGGELPFVPVGSPEEWEALRQQIRLDQA